MPFSEIECKNCKSKFIGGIFPCRTTKYCSRKCMSLSYKKPKETVSCLGCKKEFVKKRRTSKFCSTKCIKYTGPIEKLGLGKGKGFWQNCSLEEKNQRIKLYYNNLVIKLDGCWKWKNKLLSNGYTLINLGKKERISGHRASWIIHKGPIPDGIYVLHKCDNPGCTNPDHLFLGTAKDNTQDCIKKGRNNSRKGEGHYWAILCDNDVRSIREFHKLGYSQRRLAGIFKCSPSCIQGIVEGKRWKHVV